VAVLDRRAAVKYRPAKLKAAASEGELAIGTHGMAEAGDIVRVGPTLQLDAEHVRDSEDARLLRRRLGARARLAPEVVVGVQELGREERVEGALHVEERNAVGNEGKGEQAVALSAQATTMVASWTLELLSEAEGEQHPGDGRAVEERQEELGGVRLGVMIERRGEEARDERFVQGRSECRVEGQRQTDVEVGVGGQRGGGRGGRRRLGERVESAQGVDGSRGGRTEDLAQA
jgi:hypothetical protein